MFDWIHMQTPDGSLLDILRNACDLLSECDIKLPEVHYFRLPMVSILVKQNLIIFSI